MAATVTWMKKASEKVPERQRPQYASEIQLAFPEAEVVIIYDCFHGYSKDLENKIVLGVAKIGRAHV